MPYGFIYSYEDYFVAWFLSMSTVLGTHLQTVLPPYLFKYMYEDHKSFLQSLLHVQAKKGESTHKEPLAGLNVELHCNCTRYVFKNLYLVFCES